MIHRWLSPAGRYVRGLDPWRARGTASLAGLVGAAGFAPLGIFPALLLSIAGLVLLLDGASSQPRFVFRAAALGWFWGFGQFVGGLYWVGYAFMVDPASHGWQLPFAVALLTGGLALFPALAAAAASVFWCEGAARVFIFACAFGLSEWLRGHILTGFPWNIAAYGWGASLGILQSTAVIGAYGLTFLTFLFGGALAELFAAEPRYRLPAVLSAAFALIWAGGDIRLATTAASNVAGVTLRIVQPNIPQAEKYKRAYIVRNWDRLLSLSQGPSKSRLTVLIWPEAAPPFLLQREPVALNDIAQLTASGPTLITGGQRVVFAESEILRFYNSLFIFKPGGRVIGVYDKFHLVPFGEYVPLAAWLRHLGVTKITAGDFGFSPGPGPMTFSVPGAPDVGPLICYEVVFPGEIVGKRRPGWFVNVTDDSWFGPSTGPYQHLLAARVRAIEEGIPLVRSANTGISAVIDPLGRTLATLPLDEMGVLDAGLPTAVAPTPYARFGDLGFLLMTIAAGSTGVLLRRK